MSEQDGKLPENPREDEFVPRGAIAFTVALILAYGVVWFSLYFLMAGRP